MVDLDGLVLAPGFIDIHTHYDAQILWDGDLTPSSWHGVTSVVMGNCGFGLAPTRPEHRDIVVRTLENVEGMSIEALNAGIDWCFETFPEYLAAIDRRPKRLNVGAFIGHTPLRLFVLGRRGAGGDTDDEMDTMRAIVGRGHGGRRHRVLHSRQPAHQGAYGRPVPSRFAEPDEVYGHGRRAGRAGQGRGADLDRPGMFVDEFSELAVRPASR